MTKTLAISDELHKKLKIEAAKRNMDIKDLVEDKLS